MVGAADATGTLPVIDLNREEFWQDIYPDLAVAREASPVAMTTDGVTYVLRQREVDEVLRDNAFVAADLLAMMGLDEGPIWEWWQRMMFSQNPPDHTRLRTLVSRAFTPKAAEQWRERIRATVDDLLAPAFEEGRVEVMGSIAHQLPAEIMAEMMAIPSSDREVFSEWTTDIGLAFGAVGDPEVKARVESSLAHLDAYVRGLIDERHGQGGDDLLSELIAAEEGGDRLSTEELVTLVENLLFAGHDTTRGAIGVVFNLFATWKDQYARLRADGGYVPNAVEEILRYEAITFSTSRLASEDREIGGVPVAAGTPVGLCLPSASRDPRRYDDPDRFDITRTDVRPPTFGAGVHFCLGAALARVELQELLSGLLTRAEDIDLEAPARWSPFAYIRRYEELPVSLTVG